MSACKHVLVKVCVCVRVHTCPQSSVMGTRQGRVYSSLLFLPLYSAVRGPGTHPPRRRAGRVYTASRPRLHSLLPPVCVCACVSSLIRVKAFSCATGHRRRLIICESPGVISAATRKWVRRLAGKRKRDGRRRRGCGGGRSQKGVMDGTGKHICSAGCENKTRMCVVPGQPRGYR